MTAVQYQASRILPRKKLVQLVTYRIQAPMPGIVQSLRVSPGQLVRKGEELCVIEAMKMQNVIRSSIDGVIDTISISAQDRVTSGQILMEFGRNL